MLYLHGEKSGYSGRIPKIITWRTPSGPNVPPDPKVDNPHIKRGPLQDMRRGREGAVGNVPDPPIHICTKQLRTMNINTIKRGSTKGRVE